MKANLYTNVEILESGYVYINEMILESDIKEVYNNYLESSRKFGTPKIESLEGFKLKYLFIENVEYDGRKRKITDNDIKRTLEKQGYATNTGAGSIFGDFYKPTEKLTIQLDEQLKKRKKLIKQGKFINLKETA